MSNTVKITVAEHAGACYGVQRALDLVHEVAKSAQGPVRTLGPLIHNPQVVSELAAQGVSVTENVPKDAGSTLVLRTHGVVPEVEQRAKLNNLNIVDATCPYVKRVHHAAERLLASGYQVIVVGEQGHPEVEAILGHAPGAVAITSASELDTMQLSKRVGVVVQTTQAKAVLDQVISHLMSLVSEVCVVNTICEATSERQISARELATSSDVVIVIGGRNSANTKRLSEICSEVCTNVYLIETEDELESSWFNNASSIGVTAGASTPTSTIDKVVGAIKSLCE